MQRGNCGDFPTYTPIQAQTMAPMTNNPIKRAANQANPAS